MKRLLAALIAGLLSFFLAGPARGDRFPESSEFWAQFDPAPMTIISPGDVSISNPPFLHWQPLPGAASYDVKLDGKGVSLEWRTTRNFITPPKGFEPSVYRMSIQPIDAEGNVLGDASSKSFEVKREADGLDIDFNAMTLTKGAPVFWTRERMAEIKGATGTDAAFRDRLIELANETRDDRLNDPQEPERFKTGKFTSEEWGKNNGLCFQIEDWVSRETMAWAITGDQKYAEEAKRLVLIISQWNPIGSTGVWENDHSAHSMIRSMALALNVMGDQFNGDERERVKKALAARCADMYRFLNPFVGKTTSAGGMNDPDNNHPWFCNTALGLGAMALAGEDERAPEWAAFSAGLYRGVFFPRGDSNGGWHEGNDYWSYTLFFVFQFCDALDLSTGIDLMQHPWLRNTGSFAMYCHPPTGTYVPFADCKHHPPTDFDKMVMMRLASRFNDAVLWRWIEDVPAKLDRSRDVMYALLWGQDDPPTDISGVEFPFAVLYKDMGWLVSNSDPFNAEERILFAMRAGPFQGRSFGHTHADENHFVLAAGRDKLLWDAGYYDSYLSPHHRYFTRMSDAHNTILIDGIGQVVGTAGLDAKFTEFTTNGESLHVVGDASNPLIYGGRLATFIRTVDYDKAESTLVVADDLLLREAAEITFLLQSALPITYYSEDHSIEIVGQDYRLEGHFESAEPIKVTIDDTFPIEPKRPAGHEDEMPEEYRIAFRTLNKQQEWKPVFRAHWERVGSE